MRDYRATLLIPEHSSKDVGDSGSKGGPAGSLSISLALCLTRWSQAPGEGRGGKDPSPDGRSARVWA